ncbi:MAG TPA: hypothetical protein PLE54_09320 [Burkholderiaceae bacterium]|nr:hypothetical protein [Burkholderiaceae bacterium]HQR70792.1 hypothetical protein [Burkholderiaceae bacterium]
MQGRLGLRDAVPASFFTGRRAATAAVGTEGSIRTRTEGDAMSTLSPMQLKNDDEGDAPDLGAAHGLVPAILIGAGVWAILYALAVIFWG